MKTLRLSVLLVVIIMLNSSTLLSSEWETIEIKITTSDGLDLYSWFSKPDHNKKAPLLVLLPMMNHTHKSYDPFLSILKQYLDNDTLSHNNIMPYLLALDLRGHGKSTKFNDSILVWDNMTGDDFALYPYDVKNSINRVLSDSTNKINSEDIMVVGASIGSNTAIMLNEHMNGLTKVAMLSPGENYRDLQPAKALESYNGDCIIYAGKADTYSYTSSVNLSKLNKKCELKVYEGKDHGTDIINNDPEAINYLIEWLYKEK